MTSIPSDCIVTSRFLLDAHHHDMPVSSRVTDKMTYHCAQCRRRSLQVEFVKSEKKHKGFDVTGAIRLVKRWIKIQSWRSTKTKPKSYCVELIMIHVKREMGKGKLPNHITHPMCTSILIVDIITRCLSTV